jgi:hypothetical protein
LTKEGSLPDQLLVFQSKIFFCFPVSSQQASLCVQGLLISREAVVQATPVKQAAAKDPNGIEINTMSKRQRLLWRLGTRLLSRPTLINQDSKKLQENAINADTAA